MLSIDPGTLRNNGVEKVNENSGDENLHAGVGYQEIKRDRHSHWRSPKRNPALLLFAVLAGSLASVSVSSQEAKEKGESMLYIEKAKAYVAKEYPNLTGMDGFSDRLIANHLKLYQGYVNNTNILAEKAAVLLADGKVKAPEYAELKRRFGWEFNGMRLHELYFGNMGSNGIPQRNSALLQSISESFGGYEAWKTDFTATALMRGIGWVVLYRDDVSGRLFNTWIDEHDGGHLAGGVPLLVLDVFEHAYITDFQLERADYIKVFFSVIDWEEVNQRFKR